MILWYWKSVKCDRQWRAVLVTQMGRRGCNVGFLQNRLEPPMFVLYPERRCTPFTWITATAKKWAKKNPLFTLQWCYPSQLVFLYIETLALAFTHSHSCSHSRSLALARCCMLDSLNTFVEVVSLDLKKLRASRCVRCEAATSLRLVAEGRFTFAHN